MNFLSLPRGPYGRCSSPQRGGKTKKRVEEKERVEKKRRSRGIFRIEFPRWFPWFGATARKEERVGAFFFFTLAIPLATTPSFPRLNSSHPFPPLRTLPILPFQTRASFSCHRASFLLYLILSFSLSPSFRSTRRNLHRETSSSFQKPSSNLPSSVSSSDGGGDQKKRSSS